jgi:hypothetical protein
MAKRFVHKSKNDFLARSFVYVLLTRSMSAWCVCSHGELSPCGLSFLCVCVFLCVSVPFCMCLCGLSLFLYVCLCMVCINLWMFCVLMAFVFESVRSLRGNWQKNLWRDMRFNLWRSHFIVC